MKIHRWLPYTRRQLLALYRRVWGPRQPRGNPAPPIVLRKDSHFSPEERDEAIEQHQEMIRRIVAGARRRGLPPCVESDDLTQRLNEELFSILDSYRPKPGVPLDAYLWDTLRLRLNDAIKQEKNTKGRTGVRPANFHVPRARWLPFGPLGRNTRLDMQAALRILAADERRAIEMEGRGFGQDEIGVHMRLSQPSVSRLLAGAKEKLRKVLGSYETLFG